MQGIFENDGYNVMTRPKSKAAIRRMNPAHVWIEATSMFGNDYEGRAVDMPTGSKVFFVGPDPYAKRTFYGSIERNADGSLVVK
jgi:hypothetical protein